MDEGARRLGGPSRDVHHWVFHGPDPRRRLGRKLASAQRHGGCSPRTKHDAAIVGSVGVRDAQGEASNRMWMATPEGELHVYDKRHLFTLAGEHRAYRPGVERVEVTWRGWNILFQVCYDLRFPAFVRNNGSTPTTWRSMWRTGPSHARRLGARCFKHAPSKTSALWSASTAQGPTPTATAMPETA